MKKTLYYLCVILFIASSATGSLYAGGSKPKLNLKYPIILAHGWAGSDRYLNCIDYFWGIESALEDEGANVYTASMDAFNSSSIRAVQLKKQILQILAATGKSKVNIIGHSQGGVTARYMITNLAMAQKVASVTMLSTPNRGTSIADVIVNDIPGVPQWIITTLANTVWGKFMAGDARSDFMTSTTECTRGFMNNIFNPNTPDRAGVKYISYAARSYGISSNPINNIIIPSWLIIKHYDGNNDGVVPVYSGVWGEYRGEVKGLFGVDHWMIINQLFGITPGFNAEGFYIDVAKMLQGKGF
jgi:triacylglycerol lipase